MTNSIGNDPLGTAKIDDAPTKGINAVELSLSSMIDEVRTHHHALEKWFGLAATPNLPSHAGDEFDGSVQPYSLVSGDSAFGDWVQLLGPADTPLEFDKTQYDFHRILVTTTDSTNPFGIQFVAAINFSDIPTLLTNKLYTVVPYVSQSLNNDSGITEAKGKLTPSGIGPDVKLWARTACLNSNAKTINFFLGIHEYDG